MTTSSPSHHTGAAPGGAPSAPPLRQPRFDVPVELSNIATSVHQLSHHQDQPTTPNMLMSNGIDLFEQSKRIYRDAIRSVQEQISLSSRQACFAALCQKMQVQNQAQLMPKSTDDGNSKRADGPSLRSSPHGASSKKRGILSNAQDDVWSSVPELSRARQVLDDARRMVKLQKVAQKKHHATGLETRLTTAGTSTSSLVSGGACTTGNDGPNANGERILSVATIGMHSRPLIIPSVSSTGVLPKPTRNQSSSTVYTEFARDNKASEYISAIILYNFALMHHLDALRAKNLPLLVRSVDLYDMAIEVMHADLDDVFKDYAAYHHLDQEGGDDDATNNTTRNDIAGNAQAQVQACVPFHQDPTLYHLQQIARTAMGAALTNVGLIYHAFSEHDDATAVFNVLLQLCDVQSRHFLRRRSYMHQNRRRGANTVTRSTHDEDHSDSQEERVGSTANTSPSLPNSQTIGTAHASFEQERVWDHFFCAAYALRAGTIAPSA